MQQKSLKTNTHLSKFQFSAMKHWGRILFFLFYFWIFVGAVQAQVFTEAQNAISNFFKEPVHQATFRYYSFAYTDNIYYQFTGNQNFIEGNGPSPSINFHYDQYYPTQSQNFGISWGLGWSYFSATSDSTYAGDQDVTVPDVDMSLNLYDLGIAVYFVPSSIEVLRLYMGTGWGWLNGGFVHQAYIDESAGTTSFGGVMAYRDLGIEFTTPDFGIHFAIRQFKANNVKANNDPFEQAPGGDLTLVFDGAIAVLGATYNFKF